MLDSTAVVSAEREGKNARQLLESVAMQTGDDGIAVSVLTVLELAHGITRAPTHLSAARTGSVSSMNCSWVYPSNP
jgi:predicted nucleic acid-binding protein